MEGFIKRLLSEYIELQDKLYNLKKFLNNELSLDIEDRVTSPEMCSLMVEQVRVMDEYLVVLQKRLSLLNVTIDIKC